jgi:hypothetical protein
MKKNEITYKKDLIEKIEFIKSTTDGKNKQKIIDSINPDSKIIAPENVAMTRRVISYILQKNKSENLYLDNNSIFSLIKRSELDEHNNLHWPIIYIAIGGNKSNHLNFSKDQIMWLFENTPFRKDEDPTFEESLKILLKNNFTQNLNFSNNELMSLIEKSRLTHYHDSDDSETITHLCITNNKKQKLNLTTEQILWILHYSDLKKTSIAGMIPAMDLLSNNKTENLNLTAEQIYPIIMSSNLLHTDMFQKSLAVYVSTNNKTQNINLNNEQTMMILKNSNLSIREEWDKVSLFTVVNSKEKEIINLTDEQTLYLINLTIQKTASNYFNTEETKQIKELKAKYDFLILSKETKQNNQQLIQKYKI